MNIVSPEKAAAIAERAYFIYLNRVAKGIPGDEHNDWLQAVAENDAPPAPPMGAKTSAETENGAIESLKKAAKISKTAKAKKSSPKAKPDTPAIGLDAIKGIGPKIAQQLASCGIKTCADLASLTIADLDKTQPKLAARARREKWLQQAKKLAAK